MFLPIENNRRWHRLATGLIPSPECKKAAEIVSGPSGKNTPNEKRRPAPDAASSMADG
jgi:hypothetical protein